MKVIHTSGKRRKAIARATLKEGKGLVRVNSKLIDLVEPEMLRTHIQEPLLIAKDVANKVDIIIVVNGGGVNSQAEAARLAIARALVIYTKSDELKKKYLSYDRHLLVADTRYKEQRKPLTHSKARSKKQKSYR